MARRFYLRDPVEVAPLLLNKLLVRDGRVGRIVEVEAYRGEADPASHAYRGPTARNATMYGPPGRLYVYFTYGMHFCANAVCLAEGVAGAVLLRALAPLEGLDAMRAARWARTAQPGRPGSPPPSGRSVSGAVERPDRDLTSGPARLCQALGITREDDGADLVTAAQGIGLLDDGVPPPASPGVSRRVGLRRAVEMPWRWWVEGDPNVSKARAVTL